MHLNCLLDVHIIIVLASWYTIEFGVKVIEILLDFCTTWNFHCSRAHLWSFWVVSSWNCIFICLNKVSDHIPQQLHLFSILWWHSRSQVSQVILSLLSFLSDFFHDFWQSKFNMSKKNLCQFGGQVADTQKTLRHTWVHWMSTEIQLFLLDSFSYWNSINNILLGSILDSNEAKSECDILSFDHSLSVGTFVHDINLGDNTNSSNTFWIQLSCHL